MNESVGTGFAPDAPHHPRGFGSGLFVQSLPRHTGRDEPLPPHIPPTERSPAVNAETEINGNRRNRESRCLPTAGLCAASTSETPACCGCALAAGEILARLDAFPNTQAGIGPTHRVHDSGRRFGEPVSLFRRVARSDLPGHALFG